MEKFPPPLYVGFVIFHFTPPVSGVRGGHHMRVSLCQGGVGCLFFVRGGGGG